MSKRLRSFNERGVFSVEKVYVYVIECLDGTLYTGITNSLYRRYYQHKTGTGASYTRTHGVKTMLAYKAFASRGEAMREEKRMKNLSHAGKKQEIISWKQPRFLGKKK